MKKIILILATISLLTTGFALAQDDVFEAKLEMVSVSLGNPVYLYLTFYGGSDIQTPEVPAIEGLQIKHVGQSTKVSVVNGRVTQSVIHTYLIFPKRNGTYRMGPFFTERNGQTYRAEPVTLNVSGVPGAKTTSRSSSPAPAPVSTPKVSDSRPYVGDKIFLVMEVDREKVYINEVLPLRLKLYVTGMGLKEIEYPSFVHEGFTAGAFEEPERTWETVRGVKYDVLVFKRELFGIKEGNFVLGPATLRCKLIVRKETARRSSLFGRSIFNDDFFSSRFGRYDTHPIEVESNDSNMTILSFPRSGKPADFQGAVGDFNLDIHVGSRKVKVGDPIDLRMTVTGSGNLDTVTAPVLASTEGFKTYESQVSKKGGRKIYEQILIPKSDKVKEVPEVSLSFLNPRTGKYETIRKGPIKIEVMERPASEKAVKMVSMPSMGQVYYQPEELGQDIIHIKENIGTLRQEDSYLYESKLFWAGQLLPAAFFAVFLVSYRKKERIRRDKGYARFLKAPRKARVGMQKAKAYLSKSDMPQFYDAIFKTLQDYLGDRFNLPKGSVTSHMIDEKLRPAGCDEEILGMLGEVFSKCEVVRYTSSVPVGEEAEEVLENLKKIIDYLEKAKF